MTRQLVRAQQVLIDTIARRQAGYAKKLNAAAKAAAARAAKAAAEQAAKRTVRELRREDARRREDAALEELAEAEARAEQEAEKRRAEAKSRARFKATPQGLRDGENVIPWLVCVFSQNCRPKKDARQLVSRDEADEAPRALHFKSKSTTGIATGSKTGLVVHAADFYTVIPWDVLTEAIPPSYNWVRKAGNTYTGGLGDVVNEITRHWSDHVTLEYESGWVEPPAPREPSSENPINAAAVWTRFNASKPGRKR